MVKYKVKCDGSTFHVIEVWGGSITRVYSGSILEREAFIRLKEGGYLDD